MPAQDHPNGYTRLSSEAREYQRVEMVRMLNLLGDQVNFLTKTAAEQAGVIEAMQRQIDELTTGR